MAKKWREVTNNYQDAVQIKVNENKGQVTEGIYQGSKTFASQFNAGQQAYVHYITIDGQECSFYGKPMLDKYLAGVPKGTDVKITFNGLKQGKKFRYNDFKIEIADGDIPALRNVLGSTSAKKTTLKDEGEVDIDDIPF